VLLYYQYKVYVNHIHLGLGD